MLTSFHLRSRVFLGFFFFITIFSFSQTVRPIGEKGLDSLISNRNGKILVLNFWATWCLPCKEEFPDLVKLSKDLQKSKVEFAAVSVDYPDEVATKIRPFLKNLSVSFPTFVSDFDSQDELMNTVNKDWSGGIPATFIYDAKGKQRRFIFGVQSYQQFKNAIEDVLRKP